MATFSVTYSFVANTKARSAEVNQNNTDLLNILKAHHHDPNLYTNASPITNSGIAANAQILATQLQSPITRSGLINEASIQRVTPAKGGTGLLSINAGDLLYGSVGNGMRTLPIGADGSVLGVQGGYPFWTQSPAALDVQAFSGNGTWTKPTGAVMVFVELWGGGGSGGAGVQVAGGGGGGEYRTGWFLASDLAATETVTIGAGGTAVSTSGSSSGNAGGDTTFGSWLTGKGGSAGGGSGSGADIGGGSGGNPLGALTPIWGLGGSDATAGGNGFYSAGGGNVDYTVAVRNGGDSYWGGAGGGAAGNNPAATSSGGTSTRGGNGGAGARGASATATSGSAPSGGGGGVNHTSGTGTSGAGAIGKARITTFF